MPRLTALERSVSQHAGRLRLDSIRNKILAFAVLATLIPSISTAWVSYLQNKRSLTEKITEELRTVSTEAARELDLWGKERLYDLRVFTSSYVVSENVARISQSRGPALARLTDYLNSVRGHFVDYEELLVVDAKGDAVASSSRQSKGVSLPTEWQRQIRNDNAAIGEPHWDPDLKKVVIVFAVPIHLASGQFLGALAAKLNFVTADTLLHRLSPGRTGGGGQLLLSTANGAMILTSRVSSPDLMRSRLPGLQNLVAREGVAVEYRGLDGDGVVGTLHGVPRMNWLVVAEVPRAEAFRQVTRLRNVTMTIVLALLAGVGAIAYLLGLIIVRPLDRLTRGAAKVAAGDLSVDLPVLGGGEVAYLTQVFNNMVARLRESHEALERLSLTDGLTGLYNRRHLMETLTNEVRRAQRLKHGFALLMADVDNFKLFNDTHGHLAGDEVLKRLAVVLRDSTREVDCAARYGGEEFMVILPETSVEGAAEQAERIRARLESETFENGRITISIGVAEYPEFGDTPESLIAAADAALYQAKHEGRNRVVRAGRESVKSRKSRSS